MVQIYIFRLLFNKIKHYDKFKTFIKENEIIKPLAIQLDKKYSFEDPPFKLDYYCKKMFEDFLNDDDRSLPYNYNLRGYDFGDRFPYDSNVINIKMVNNKEVRDVSINCYENNLQFVTRMAILIVSNASEHLISTKELYSINQEINKLFKKKNKSINTLFNEAIFELTGNLHLNLIKELKELLSKKMQKENNKLLQQKNSNDYTLPDIIVNNFCFGSNDINKYNERTLGILLYALKISLTIFIFDDKENYFYSYLTMTENSPKDIIDLLDNSRIPGYNLSKIGLSNQENDYERSISISILTLRFILYSNLFFTILTKKMSNDYLKKYGISNKNIKDEKYSCLQSLIYLWNILEQKLNEEGVAIIEIYFNLINKFLPYILKKFTMEVIKSKEKTEIFVEDFNTFIKACKDNYKEYS